MILHHFCRRSSNIILFSPRTLIFDQQFRKYLKNPKKYSKFLGFLRTPLETPVETPVEDPTLKHCETLQSPTRAYSEILLRTIRQAGPAAKMHHCSRSVLALSSPQITRSSQVHDQQKTTWKKEKSNIGQICCPILGFSLW